MWWFEFIFINCNINFSYNKNNLINYFNTEQYFLFFLINKKNVNNLLFYLLDGVITKHIYYISFQTIFFDYKILLNCFNLTKLLSISNIYKNFSWVERELKEINKIMFIGLKDSRKLLLNYNYNIENQYINYNNIINDIKI